MPSSHGNNTDSEDERGNKGELLPDVSLCPGMVYNKRNEWAVTQRELFLYFIATGTLARASEDPGYCSYCSHAQPGCQSGSMGG